VRNSWGKRMWDLGAPVIFSVGRLYSEKEDKEILDEAREFNDILVWDFLDTYDNLTLKSILNVLWVVQHCPRAKSSFYTDVDVVVLPDRLLNFSENLTSNSIAGYSFNNSQPIRDKNSKW